MSSCQSINVHDKWRPGTLAWQHALRPRLEQTSEEIMTSLGASSTSAACNMLIAANKQSRANLDMNNKKIKKIFESLEPSRNGVRPGTTTYATETQKTTAASEFKRLMDASVQIRNDITISYANQRKLSGKFELETDDCFGNVEVNKLREIHAGMQWATMGHMLSLSQSNDDGKPNQASRFTKSSEMVLDALKAEKQARRKRADEGQWHYDNGMSTETSTKLRDLQAGTKDYIALAREYGGRSPNAETSVSRTPGSSSLRVVSQGYSEMSPPPTDSHTRSSARRSRTDRRGSVLSSPYTGTFPSSATCGSTTTTGSRSRSANDELRDAFERWRRTQTGSRATEVTRSADALNSSLLAAGV